MVFIIHHACIVVELSHPIFYSVTSVSELCLLRELTGKVHPFTDVG